MGPEPIQEPTVCCSSSWNPRTSTQRSEEQNHNYKVACVCVRVPHQTIPHRKGWPLGAKSRPLPTTSHLTEPSGTPNKRPAWGFSLPILHLSIDRSIDPRSRFF